MSPSEPEPEPGPVSQPEARRDLPDFLKHGDPALTWPLGKAPSRNHPKGLPREPYANEPQTVAHDLARDWLDHLAAGRVGGS